MCEQKLFSGLLGMCGKVRFLWWAPPCTTFSLARSPKRWGGGGFNLLDEATMLGNLHAVQSLLLALIQLEQGIAFCGEQRAFGLSLGSRFWLEVLLRSSLTGAATVDLLKRPRGSFATSSPWRRLERDAIIIENIGNLKARPRLLLAGAGAWDTFEAQPPSGLGVAFRVTLQGSLRPLGIRVLWAGSSGTGFRGHGRSGALRSGQSSSS